MKVRTEARRTAIVEEAARLFREQGYERASMNELALRLGGSKATLYGYFPSKQELFLAVTQAAAETHLGAALAELERLAEIGLEEGLNRFAQGLISVMGSQEGISLYRMVVAEAGHSEIGELFKAYGPRRVQEAVGQALRGAIARGELRDAPVALMAMQLMALIKAETDDWIFLREPPRLTRAQLRSVAMRAVAFFLRGYAPDGPARAR